MESATTTLNANTQRTVINMATVSLIGAPSVSWDISNNARSDRIGEPQRHPLPRLDCGGEIPIRRAGVRRCRTRQEDVLPVERRLLCAPLPLEMMWARVTAGTAEIADSR